MAGADQLAAEAGLYVAEGVARGLRAQVTGLAAEAQGAGVWSSGPAGADAYAVAGAATKLWASPDLAGVAGVGGNFACGPSRVETEDLAFGSQASPLAAVGLTRPVVKTNTVIDQILMGTAWAGDTIYYSFPIINEGVKTSFNEAQKEVCRVIFGELNHLLGVDFKEWTGSGSPADGPVLSFGNWDNPDWGGIGEYPNNSGPGSLIWISSHNPALLDPDPGKHQWVFLHEIGHALGLKHPFDTDGGFPGDVDSGHFETDMSYTAYGANHPGGASMYYAQTFMPLDIRALQHLYGKNQSSDGNDTYTVTASNDSSVLIVSADGAASLYDLSYAGQGGLYVASWDSGGADKLSFSGFHRPVGQVDGVRVYVQADRLSAFLGKLDPDFNVLDDPDIEPLPDPPAIRLMLDQQSWFETIEGSAHNDLLDGSAASRALTLAGEAGVDTLIGGAAADTLIGGVGNDRLDGGAGVDTLSFAGVVGAVTVKLSSGSVSGAAGIDTIFRFERVLGGAGGDSLSGDDAANTLMGGGGNDFLAGLGGSDNMDGEAGDDTILAGLGADTLAGGVGIDTLSLAEASAAVAVDLKLQKSSGPLGADHISGFERVLGGAGGDSLSGDDAANTLVGGGGGDLLSGLGGSDRLEGGEGDDTVRGGNGGDTLIGGGGIDTLSYADVAAAITVDLAQGRSTGIVGPDTISGFEEVLGGLGADRLTGDSAGNRLDGGGGADSLAGGAGGDLLSGGAGVDTAVYADAGADLVVDLLAGTASGEGADTLNGIENVIAGQGDDRLTGNRFANRLEGGRGADELVGGTGADVLVGGRDADQLTGGSGVDRFVYLAPTDSRGAARDSILDLAARDVIDLSAIDADAAIAGDQAFTLAAAFDGRSGLLVLTYNANKDSTLIQADIDGDTKADMTIAVSGDKAEFEGFVL